MRQGRSGKAWKISPPPGFDPRKVQGCKESLYQLSYPGSVRSTNRRKLSYLMDVNGRGRMAPL